MISLPENCKVDRFIPKNKFYEKSNINNKIKAEFIDKIKKITWKYKLSEETVGIKKTKEVEEIQIFEIELKIAEIPKKALQIIDKSIPYVILYNFIYENNYCYAIALKNKKNIEKYYFSNWNEDINFEFYGIDLKNCYQNIIKKFIKRNINPSLDFEKIIKIDNELEKLEKEISILEKKMINEKQFKRKAEIHKKIKEIKNKIEEIKAKYYNK
ncbi:DUF4391 domain-containing protein [Marinitoga sp. 1155]|uniref:DUF4391 domain-containing protein n=1 Tax=Marinitoga sp. 1155 TaxID=1428448 RepID=UPI0006410C4F|nr:DUF4391 domain-containing protein [Marinitoga sp. 1155]KLO24964.1 hypothetical protein X274_00085 [Marinitoga sp. 1155]